MELLDIDLNRIDVIIKFKETLLSKDTHPNLPEPSPLSTRNVNEYGEIVASKIQQSQKRLTDVEIKQLINGYEEGKSTYTLAEQFDCHRLTVSRVLGQHGVTVSRCRGQKKLDIADVIKMYEENSTSQEIADKYDVGPNVILRCLREYGVAIKNRWDYEKISCP